MIVFFNLLAFLIFANQFVHGINKYYMLHFTWGGNKLQGYIGCGGVFLHYMLHGGWWGVPCYCYLKWCVFLFIVNCYKFRLVWVLLLPVTCKKKLCYRGKIGLFCYKMAKNHYIIV